MVIKTRKAFTLRDSDTGLLTSLACGAISTVADAMGNHLISIGYAVEYSPLVPEGTKSITSNGTYDVTQYASANVAVEPSLHISVAPVADGIDLLGKDASDLQENIAIADGAITGTLKYVTGYTGFSGDSEQQSGNFIALKFEAVAGSTITVELINGTVGHPVTLDADGMIVIRVSDTSTQSIEIVATSGNISETQTLTITDLVLAES